MSSTDWPYPLTASLFVNRGLETNTASSSSSSSSANVWITASISIQPPHPSSSLPPSFLLSSQAPRLKAGSTPRSDGRGRGWRIERVVTCNREVEVQNIAGQNKWPSAAWGTVGSLMALFMTSRRRCCKSCREKTRLPGCPPPPANPKGGERKSLHALQKMQVT